MVDDLDRVVREAHLEAPPDVVWEALADLGAWFGAEVSADLRPGGRITFVWPDGSSTRAIVERVEPHRELCFRWLPFERGPDGLTRQRRSSRVRMELRPAEGGTVLTVTESREAAWHASGTLSRA